MIVILNGADHDVEPGVSVKDLFASLRPDLPNKGIAVAVNGEVVPRSQWDSRGLDDHDQVQVVSAVQGG